MQIVSVETSRRRKKPAKERRTTGSLFFYYLALFLPSPRLLFSPSVSFCSSLVGDMTQVSRTHTHTHVRSALYLTEPSINSLFQASFVCPFLSPPHIDRTRATFVHHLASGLCLSIVLSLTKRYAPAHRSMSCAFSSHSCERRWVPTQC